VRIRYATPEFHSFLTGNITNTQAQNPFDYESYYLFFNSSLMEVMSSVTEQVIDDVVTQNTKDDATPRTTSPGTY